MGLRGPLRDPDSIRGRREAERAARMAKLAPIDGGSQPVEPVHPEVVTIGGLPCPEELPERIAKVWRKLVDDLLSAKVPIKAIDSHAIEMAARCMDTIRQSEEIANNSKLRPPVRLTAMRLGNQASRDLQKWLEMIGATPGSRARIGVKSVAEKPMGTLAKIMLAKQALK